MCTCCCASPAARVCVSHAAPCVAGARGARIKSPAAQQPPQPPPAAQQHARAVASAERAVAGGVKSRAALAPAPGAVAKQKRKYESGKLRRKRQRREAAAAAAVEQAPRDAPRFGEVVQAPPAAMLARKQSLGRLFQKQLEACSSKPPQPAAKRMQRKRLADQDPARLGAIAHYRKLKGHEALPYTSALEHTLQEW